MCDALIEMEDPGARDQRRESIAQTPESTPFAPRTQRSPIATRVFVFSIVRLLDSFLQFRQVVRTRFVASGCSREDDGAAGQERRESGRRKKKKTVRGEPRTANLTRPRAVVSQRPATLILRRQSQGLCSLDALIR